MNSFVCVCVLVLRKQVAESTSNEFKRRESGETGKEEGQGRRGEVVGEAKEEKEAQFQPSPTRAVSPRLAKSSPIRRKKRLVRTEVHPPALAMHSCIVPPPRVDVP